MCEWLGGAQFAVLDDGEFDAAYKYRDVLPVPTRLRIELWSSSDLFLFFHTECCTPIKPGSPSRGAFSTSMNSTLSSFPLGKTGELNPEPIGKSNRPR